MKIVETYLKGCYVIIPTVFKDERGLFFETFQQRNFNRELGFNVDFVQDNESISSKGVLRGLHYQTGEYSQAKLVRVISGSVIDVVVDLRKDSITFGKHLTVKLTNYNKKQIFIPRGFAHGFLTLEDHTVFNYKCDNFYNKSSEAGIIYNDPHLNIDWQFPKEELIISEKDKNLPTFKSLFK